jgi:glycosyltransferase involved in cell wall biosynthesis
LEPAQVSEIPDTVHVVRAFALDAQRHFSLWGRYPLWCALPDRWVSWCLGAVPAGLRAIYRHHVRLILSTFPVASAVLIGWILHRLTGKPWVVDFRDPMTEDTYPENALTRRLCRWIEQQAIQSSSCLIFTAPSTLQKYLKRYPHLPPGKCKLIPNGYDEIDFRDLALSPPAKNLTCRSILLLHLGLLYPDDRDPMPFFRAVARLKKEGRYHASDLRINLRAPGSEAYYARCISQLGIEDLVQILPHLPYRQALQEAAEADGLLLFQGATCDHQIPAKAYEYLRLGKPILALTTQTGDTAMLLRECGGARIVDMIDEESIYKSIPDFLASLRNGSHCPPDPRVVSRYNRRIQMAHLARCLSDLCP